MFRVRVLGLPYFAKPDDLFNFFDKLAVSRVFLMKAADGAPLGAAGVEFASAQDAVTAVEDYHGRFLGRRRLGVYGGEGAARVVREEFSPAAPVVDRLRDEVHKKAVGGKWPTGNTFGMISHKNRYRRYKPPGNPKPRHG